MRRLVLLSLTLLAAPLARAGDVAERLVRLAPGLDPRVAQLATQALSCATGQSADLATERLAIIDYSRPSTEPRLWVFDLRQQALLYVEHVTHGSGSGENHTTQFSNRPGSHQTSLGLFRTRETYNGRNGYSLRLDGLDKGFNDRARERAIVMHGAPYVNDEIIRTMGRLGRSQGCPAVREAIATPLIDSLKDGQYVFAFYPDQEWLQRSALLSCPPARFAALAVARVAPGTAQANSAL